MGEETQIQKDYILVSGDLTEREREREKKNIERDREGARDTDRKRMGDIGQGRERM